MKRNPDKRPSTPAILYPPLPRLRNGPPARHQFTGADSALITLTSFQLTLTLQAGWHHQPINTYPSIRKECFSLLIILRPPFLQRSNNPKLFYSPCSTLRRLIPPTALPVYFWMRDCGTSTAMYFLLSRKRAVLSWDRIRRPNDCFTSSGSMLLKVA
jgi:hypothetical protein